MAKTPKDLAASVRQRLLNLSRKRGRVFEVVLVTYGLERLIYRLSISRHRDNFVLKGGMLVTLWTADEKRVTRDADFLGHGDASEDHLKSVFAELMSLASDDGLAFDTESLTAQAIKAEQVNGSVRLKTSAYLGKTRIPITVDIGFGDAMTERDHTIEYPSLLEMPTANVRAYSPATVIAEKFQAIVSLGLANSRMKDYYDLWAINNAQAIEAQALDTAIRATFERRNTAVPKEVPVGLSDEFVGDAQKMQQWGAYTASIDIDDLSLDSVVETIWSYIGPACERLTDT